MRQVETHDTVVCVEEGGVGVKVGRRTGQC